MTVTEEELGKNIAEVESQLAQALQQAQNWREIVLRAEGALTMLKRLQDGLPAGAPQPILPSTTPNGARV